MTQHNMLSRMMRVNTDVGKVENVTKPQSRLADCFLGSGQALGSYQIVYHSEIIFQNICPVVGVFAVRSSGLGVG